MSRNSEPLDATEVARLYAEFSAELRAFLLGVLRNPDLANEALQATFVKVLEVGNTAQKETFKGWLFKVALHEALGIRRKRLRDQNFAERSRTRSSAETDLPEGEAIRQETVEQVGQRLKELPPEQERIVRMKIFEELTFAEIARELNLPLGTVQTRLRLALQKLSQKLDHDS